MALAGGILSAVAVLALLIVGTYAVYIKLRQKYANVKWTLEIVCIGFVLAVSIGVKMAVFCLADKLCTFLDGFNACIRAIYAGIGGLTFEGLESFAEKELIIQLQCAYFASSAYAGIMTLIIISAKANYEVYSWLCLHLPKGNKNIHVITALTEETLYLARDIKQEDHRAIIAFAGPTLEAFDRRNELCREVMALGVLYWSYSPQKDKDKAKSVFGSLFWPLPRSNFNQFKRRYCVYAFEAKNHIPQEENNLELIATDIRMRSRRADKLRIEYYLLTQREINYQAYQQINDELQEEYVANTRKQFEAFCAAKQQSKQTKAPAADLANQSNAAATSQDKQPAIEGDQVVDKPKSAEDKPPQGEEDSEKKKQDEAKKKEDEGKKLRREYYSSHVVLTIWCEALTIGRQTIRQLMTVPVGDDRRTLADVLAEGNDGIRVWTIGFAATGQAITGELYTQTAGVDAQNKLRDFFVDVFDPDADELGGIYRATRPRAYYLNDGMIAADDKWQNIERKYNTWADSSPEVNARTKESCRQYLQGTALPLHCRENDAVPIFRFHNVSCNEFSFFERIDKHVGAEYRKNEYAQSVKAVLDADKETAGNAVQQKENTTGKVANEDKKTIAEPAEKADEKTTPCAAKEEAQTADTASKKEKKLSIDQAVKDVLEHARQSTMPEYPQFVVVSTGDDYRNVQLANAIVQDIVNESLQNSSDKADEQQKQNAKQASSTVTTKTEQQAMVAADTVGGSDRLPIDHFNMQYIIVNVWDKRNARLLVKGNGVWNKAHDVLIAKDYVLLVVGNNDRIYTMDTMRAGKVPIDYNHAYNTFSGLCNGAKEQAINNNLAHYIKKSCKQEPQTQTGDPAADITADGDQTRDERARVAGEQQVQPLPDKQRTDGANRASETEKPVSIEDAWRRYTELKMLYYALQRNSQQEAAADEDKSTDEVAVKGTAQDIKRTQTTRKKEVKPSKTDKVQDEVIWQVQKQIQSLDLTPTQKDAIRVACNGLFALFAKDNPSLLYATSDLWDRESTIDATMFAPVLRSCYQTVAHDDCQKELDGIARLCNMEHERWQRKHWINGWLYKNESNKPLRQHRCLCPFDDTEEKDVINDLANVLWAISALFVDKE